MAQVLGTQYDNTEVHAPSCDKKSSACQERLAWVRAAERRKLEAERAGEALHFSSCDSITQVRSRPDMRTGRFGDTGPRQDMCSSPLQGFYHLPIVRALLMLASFLRLLFLHSPGLVTHSGAPEPVQHLMREGGRNDNAGNIPLAACVLMGTRKACNGKGSQQH